MNRQLINEELARFGITEDEYKKMRYLTYNLMVKLEFLLLAVQSIAVQQVCIKT